MRVKELSWAIDFKVFCFTTEDSASILLHLILKENFSRGKEEFEFVYQEIYVTIILLNLALSPLLPLLKLSNLPSCQPTITSLLQFLNFLSLFLATQIFYSCIHLIHSNKIHFADLTNFSKDQIS